MKKRSDVRARFLEEKRKGYTSRESPLSNVASGVWLSLLATMKENLHIVRSLKVKKKHVFYIHFQTCNSKTV